SPMRRSAVVADILVTALLAAAIAIAWTGGGRIQVAGTIVSARSWARPLAAAILLFVAVRALALARRRVRPALVGERFATLVTAALVIAGLTFTAVHIIHACGGLDSHGYVAFSQLLSR